MRPLFSSPLILAFFWFCFAGQIVVGQNEGQTSPEAPNVNPAEQPFVVNKLIFKVNERYGANCKPGSIELPELKAALAAVGATSYGKIYPRHQAPREKFNKFGDELVDLSTIYEATLTGKIDAKTAAAKLRGNPYLKYVEPRWIMQSFNPPPQQFVPNEPSINTAGFWWINAVMAKEAWFITKGDATVTIGVVDTGFDLDHPDLINKIRILDPVNGVDDDGDGYIDNNGIDLVGADLNNPVIDLNPSFLALPGGSNHGAMVAGCACAQTNNAQGACSPGFNATFLPIKAAGDNGSSLVRANEGIVYAADRGCQIINCSLGQFIPSPYQQDVTDYATFNKNALVVAAAGNGNIQNPAFPAANDNVLAITGLNSSSVKSSTGNYYYLVDLAAPATMTCPTYNNTYTSNATGFTSHACPMAASMAALVKAYFPSYSALQVGERVRVTADNIYGIAGNASYIDKLGKGRPNMYRMLTDVTPAVRIKRSTINLVDANGNKNLEPNETVNLSAMFRNFLDPTSGNVTVTLSSPDANVTILQGTANLGTLATLGTADNNATPFQIRIGASTPTDYQLFLKFTYTSGAYSDFEYYYIWANQSWQDVRINKLQTSITSEGPLGFRNWPDNWQGTGVYFDNKYEAQFESSLLIGTSSATVADAMRNAAGNARETDFTILQKATIVAPGSITDVEATSKYTSTTLAQPLEVTEKLYADAAAPRDKYVIKEYAIKNTGASALSNVYVGLFNDLDVVNYATNRGFYDPVGKIAYTTPEDQSVMIGAALLSNGTVHVQSNDNFSLVTDAAAKFTGISNGTVNAEVATTGDGTDISQYIGVGPYTLQPGETRTVVFAILGGYSLADLHNSVNEAKLRYYANKPNVRFAAATPSVSQAEGNSGSYVVNYNVQVNNVTSFPVNVTTNLNTAATVWTDYKLNPLVNNMPQVFTFNANGVKTYSVTVYSDQVVEPNETIDLIIQNTGLPESIMLLDPMRTTTMLNDDVATGGTLTFDASTPSLSVVEGNSSYINYPMKVTLSGANTFPVVAQLDFTGSTGTRCNTFGCDFNIAGLTTALQLNYTANGSKTFNVSVLGDVVPEADDIANMTLSSPTPNVTIGDNARVVTILNDDSPRQSAGDNETLSNLALYPNPNNGQFELSFVGNSGEARLRVIDLQGKTVYDQTQITIEGQNLLPVDLSVSPGLYLIELSVGADVYRSRCVIKD